MTTKSMVESAWAENMGQFLYHRDPGIRKNKIKNNKQCSIVFNKACLNNNLLPKYTLFNIYIYIYIYIERERGVYGLDKCIQCTNEKPYSLMGNNYLYACIVSIIVSVEINLENRRCFIGLPKMFLSTRNGNIYKPKKRSGTKIFRSKKIWWWGGCWGNGALNILNSCVGVW